MNRIFQGLITFCAAFLLFCLSVPAAGQCTGFGAVINSITISPLQVSSGSKPSISASVKNTSVTTNGYGGAATFAVKVRMTYPSGSYVEAFVSPNVSFNYNETKTISNPTTYSTTAYGTYNVTYYVYNIPDKVCLFSSLSKTFTVAATPTISNTSPASSSTGCVNQTITFSMRANDVEGNLKMIEWYKDGVYTGTTHMVSGSAATDSWSTSWTSSGSKKVESIAYDQYNLAVGYTWNLTINGAPAAPSLSSPSSNSIIKRNTSSSFSWGSVSGATSYDIQFDSETPVNTTSLSYSRSWTSGGSHTWKVRANNSCGNGSYTSSRTIIVNDPPAISNLSPAGSSSLFINEVKTFSLTASDVDGNLKMCEWYFNDGTGYVYTNETDMISGSSQAASRTQTFTRQGGNYVKAIVYDQYDNTAAFEWPVTVNPATGNLQVNLKNKNGIAVGSGHKILRYNSSYSLIDQLLTTTAGSALWSSVPVGTYYAEGYTNYQQALWGECFWGSVQGVVTANTTTTATITQNQPSIELITLNGSNFTPGSTVHVELQVRNPGTSGSEVCQVEIKIDKDKAASWDYDPGVHGPVTINYGQLGYFGYDWIVPANISQGTYYLTARLATQKSSGFTTTDATGWDKSFTIINTAPVISNTSPASPVTVVSGDQVTFSLTGTDAQANLKMCEWYFDDGSGYVYTNETDMISGGSASASYIKTFLTTGSKKLKAVLYDQADLTAVYEWLITSNPQTGNADVTLLDRNNVKVTAGNKILRYNQSFVLSDFKTTDANGKAIWTAIPVGTYYFEGYNTTLQSLWGELFWGARQSVITKGQTTVTSIVQSEPYIESVTVNGPSFVPGTVVHIEVVVKNPATVVKTCQADIRIDKDKAAAYDHESGFHGPVAIDPGMKGYFGYDWTVPANATTGTCYVAARLQTSFNAGYNNTDATGWNNSFQVESSLISQIQWSGYTWNVRNGTGGPGTSLKDGNGQNIYNNWLASSGNVWVDGSGNLHMKIRKIGDTWYCSEISSVQSLGHGEYTFQVSSRIDQLDKNVVLGLFTYENDTREIDLEFSRWGVVNGDNGWYVVQPSAADSRDSYLMALSGDYTTHKFQWSASKIFFQSYFGHYADLPGNDFLINEWTYTGAKNPPAGAEKVHLNLWLTQSIAPSNQLEAEVILSSFTFKNSYAPSVVTKASSNTETTTASVSGTVNPNGLASSAWVEYGLTTTYGSSIQAVNVPAGSSDVQLNFQLSGLQPDKLYHYRVAASNSSGTSYGDDMSFTTKFAPVKLAVPYYMQADASWCWAASISMMLKYYGMDRKAWEIAADLDKYKDQTILHDAGANTTEIKGYLNGNFSAGFTNPWVDEKFYNNQDLVNRIKAIISTHNPILLCKLGVPFVSGGHAVVITGYSLEGLYIHDPSGYLFGDLVNHYITWADFIQKIDDAWFSPFGDCNMVYTLSPIPESHGSVTIQLNPTMARFTNGYGLPSGHYRSLDIEWDGREPYKGYRYVPMNTFSEDTWYPADASLDFQATNADFMRIAPAINNFTNPLVSRQCKLVLQIINSGNNVVKNFTSPLFNVPGENQNPFDFYQVFPGMKMKDLPAGLYTLELKLLDSQDQLQDQLKVTFRISQSDFADITVVNNNPSHLDIYPGDTGSWQFTITNLGSKQDYVKLGSTDGEIQYQYIYQGSPIATTPVLLPNQSVIVELRVPTENMPVGTNKEINTSFKPLNDQTININTDLSYTVSNTTETAENPSPEYSIYPNPVADILFLRGDNLSQTTVRIVDINGRVWLNRKPENNSLDVSMLPSGIYFLRTGTAVLRFIKY